MVERPKVVIERVVPGIDLTNVSRDTRLVEDLGFDSLALMMMSMEIEDAFDFKFLEFIKFETVGGQGITMVDVIGLEPTTSSM